MPMLEVKLYIYQLFRSLAYIHSQGICHRDIKPQNLLLDPSTGVLKLCDFGSAKILVPDEPNVSYICSRYYRAPELIFGATNYTTKIGTLSLSHRTRRQSAPSELDDLLVLCLRRCMVDRMRHGRIDARATTLPRRIRHRPTRRDHQSARHAHSRANPHHEPELHGTQVSADQAPSLSQGESYYDPNKP